MMEPGTVDAPVFDAYYIGYDDEGMIVLGIGDDGQPPLLALKMCPCEGVEELIESLRACAREANRKFPQHRLSHGPRPNRAQRRSRRPT